MSKKAGMDDLLDIVALPLLRLETFGTAIYFKLALKNPLDGCL
jgi:hypothetical protein